MLVILLVGRWPTEPIKTLEREFAGTVIILTGQAGSVERVKDVLNKPVSS